MQLTGWTGGARLLVRAHWIGLTVAGIAVTIYALLGFFLVPKLARSALTGYITQTLHRRVELADLAFNPFTFVVRARGFALSEQDGAPLVSFSSLLINAELSSLPRRAIVLKEVRLESPDIEVLIAKDGTVNLARLAPPSQEPAPKTSEPLPRVRIGQLAVVGGKIGIRDESRDEPVSLALSPIQFALADFSTESHYQNAYRFSGSTLAGEHFDWSGEFTVQPLGSAGQFKVDALQAATIDAYLEEVLPPKLLAGQISLRGSYRFALSPLALNLNVPTVAVRDLKIANRAREDEVPIRLPAIDVTDVLFSYDQRSLHVKRLALTQPHVDLVRDEKGGINLLALVGTNATPPAKKSSPPVTVGMTTSATAPPAASWRAVVDSCELIDASIAAEDRTISPAATFSFAPINLTANSVSSDARTPIQLSAAIGVNESGKVSAAGSLTREPLGGKFDLDVATLPLLALQPYLTHQTQVALSSGNVALHGATSFATVRDKPLSIRFAGDLFVRQLKSTDRLTNDRLLAWDELAINGIDFGLAPDKLRIEKIVASKPYARVVIEKDRTLNITNVLSSKPPVPPTDAPTDTATATDEAPPRASIPPSTRVPAAKPFPAEVKSIEVISGAARFADNSVNPTFNAGIVQLQGSVRGLSSNPKSRAQVKLVGKVDRYAPVDITGQVNVLSAAKYTDLAMNFRNMELTLFNPYSGKFAGYNISRGKLSTELHYIVQDRKLDAQHHIVLDNLEFGAKTESKDAAPVPVKLVVAILKDRNGIIDLQLPVSGSLDDPKFRLGPIVWQAVLGLFKKIATAPFAAIGALFGSGPELAYIDFPAGKADLSPVELEKVQKLAQALDARPQLKLNLPMTVYGDADRAALANEALRSQVSDTSTGTVSADEAAKQYLNALERLYKTTLKSSPEYPESSAKDAAKVAERTAFLKEKLLAALQPDDQALGRLGRARARAVQDQLLTNTKIDPERVFVTTEPTEKPIVDGHARMQMKLE